MPTMDKIGKTATTVGTSHGGWHIVTYHDTQVVRWNERENVVILDSGGWKTFTTKTRMNQTSNEYCLGYRVFQNNHKWYVSLSTGETMPFTDGMEFKLT